MKNLRIFKWFIVGFALFVSTPLIGGPDQRDVDDKEVRGGIVGEIDPADVGDVDPIKSCDAD